MHFFVQPSQFIFRLIYRPKCARNWILMRAERGIMAIIVRDGPVKCENRFVDTYFKDYDVIARWQVFFSESPTPARDPRTFHARARLIWGGLTGPPAAKGISQTFQDEHTLYTRTHNRSNRGLCLWLCKNFSFARRMPADRVQMKTFFYSISSSLNFFTFLFYS